eukprot:TRINITY_DN27030_c0_g1_i1.p1 TRINITY_DN27030_c0_g1~~TRINITY_DN27030_c0_g1_i1.p1  ORF type:complete len:232 (+),score=40.89 TRINITY_DN27030_c0_g1_i1:52-747(+)
MEETLIATDFEVENCFMEKRKICTECERPERVCLCPYFPNPRIKTRIKVILLQHPKEEKRQIRTGRLLEKGLQESSFQVIKSRKFPGSNEALKKILENKSTVLLFPGQGARELSENSPPDHDIETLLILDGTWDQAKKMYLRNPALHNIQKIMLNLSTLSEYSVRTQPNEHGLSTIESAAHTIAILESRPEILPGLLKPLHSLCRIQLDFGEVVHHSKQTKFHTDDYTSDS